MRITIYLRSLGWSKLQCGTRCCLPLVSLANHNHKQMLHSLLQQAPACDICSCLVMFRASSILDSTYMYPGLQWLIGQLVKRSCPPRTLHPACLLFTPVYVFATVTVFMYHTTQCNILEIVWKISVAATCSCAFGELLSGATSAGCCAFCAHNVVCNNS